MAAAAPSLSVYEARALRALFAPVDEARAVFRGLVLVGHRRSIEQHCMFWALPGCGFADSITLRNSDPQFTILNGLAPVELAKMRRRIERLREEEKQ